MQATVVEKPTRDLRAYAIGIIALMAAAGIILLALGKQGLQSTFVLTSQRQFYVGHTYESLQMIGLALPADDGAVIFSINSVFTDQITGFFAGVAQSVGQSRTKENMTKHFKTVRQKIQ